MRDVYKFVASPKLRFISVFKNMKSNNRDTGL